MLNIDAIQEGIVIDHITAGTGMKIYDLLGVGELDCCVAVIQNARSEKFGKKDIIKIEGLLDIDLSILGYVDPNITVDFIRDGVIVEKKQLVPPEKLVNVISCKNPRCITSVEEEIDQIFLLTSGGHYRCMYCEQEYHAQ